MAKERAEADAVDLRISKEKAEAAKEQAEAAKEQAEAAKFALDQHSLISMAEINGDIYLC